MGLVQRVLEASGIPTVALSMIPELTRAVGVPRLAELAAEGAVGCPAPTHYSVMGYILEPQELVEKTAPAIAERMRAERVDAAALVPA